LKNGQLLRVASGEVLLTGDTNLQFQQNPTRLPVAVIIIMAVNNRLETLRPLIPQVLEVLTSIRAGELLLVGD
jgi:hypothetical protein